MHRDGVALALAPRAAASLLSWEACGSRLLRAKLLLEKGLHLWVIVAYAPTATNLNEAAKDQFYDALSDLIAAIPARDVTLILGDFNAQVGCDFSNWKGTIGRHSFPTKNGLPTENVLRLLSFCCHYHLTIVSTFFQHRRRLKVTWRHLNKATADTCIDHIIISARHLSCVPQARAYRVHFGRSDNGTSHNLLGGTLQLRLRATPRTSSATKQRRFNTQLFQAEHVKERYAAAVLNRFQALAGLGSVEYKAGCEVFMAATTEVLGAAPRHSQHTGQLSEETKQLLRAKHALPKSSHS